MPQQGLRRLRTLFPLFEPTQRTGASGKPVFFLVSSHGVNASRWLAKTLSSHPEIVCTHGAAELEFALDHEYKDDRSLSDDRRARRRAQSAARKTRSLDDIFNELQAVRPAKAYGNVHMFTIQELDGIAKQARQFHDKFEFRSVNIIRHPVARISSWVAMTNQVWENRFDEDGMLMPALPTFLQQTAKDCLRQANELLEREQLTHIYSFQEHFGKDNYRDILMLCALKENLALALLHLQYPHIYSITKERLTTDPDYFGLFMAAMLPQELASPAFIESAIRSDAFNVRRPDQEKDSNPLSPRKDFAGWPDWLQEMFVVIGRRYDFPSIYRNKQYDFSFAE